MSYYFVKHIGFTLYLTPWSRVLTEKLTGLLLVRKFPAFYGTRRFIAAFTRVCHLSLSWASLIQCMPSYPTSRRFCDFIVRRLSFDGELLAPRLTPKLEDHPFSAARQCLFDIFAVTVYIWGPFLQPQPEDEPCHCDRDPLITGFYFIKTLKTHWTLSTLRAVNKFAVLIPATAQ